MNPRTAFLRDIARRRFDHLPRLVYADWLDEQSNDADTLAAEFIRVGVALANGVESHRPSAVCDCERCRLVRRQAELFDVMAHASLVTDGGYQPSGMLCDFATAHYSGGFPVIAQGRWGVMGLAEMPLAVGRVFLAYPMNTASIDFWVMGGRPVRRQTWRIAVKIFDANESGGGRVTASVGPVVNNNFHQSFGCNYSVDHAGRVPTLVRKAVRRCLTNRESNSVRMGRAVPVDPTEFTRTITPHRVIRRRGNR